jgi:hypothetical protein
MKERMNIKDGKDDSWYAPLWFKKTMHPIAGVEYHEFQERNVNGTNYWKAREMGDWSGSPHVFDDDCEPFSFKQD